MTGFTVFVAVVMIVSVAAFGGIWLIIRSMDREVDRWMQDKATKGDVETLRELLNSTHAANKDDPR